jgi:lipid-binding SYLF domain-containing protein
LSENVVGPASAGHCPNEFGPAANSLLREPQLTVGLQLGGQACSQIIFFDDKRALAEFTSGNFGFGAQANAVAITAGVSATASTTGSSAGAGGSQHDAST